MQRQAALSSGFHMVQIRDDIVVLDVGTDTYACLVGGGSALSLPEPGLVCGEADILAELQSAGWITAGPPRRHRIAQPPDRELPLDGRAEPALILSTAVRALCATRDFRRQPLSRLVATGRRQTLSASTIDLDRIAARTSAYRFILPVLPFEDVCLQRAYQLREALAADGQTVDWVFGVRTWPFFAHCWLQIGSSVIGDRLDRVRSFTPIAVF